jgi:hypothetical protein
VLDLVRRFVGLLKGVERREGMAGMRGIKGMERGTPLLYEK